MLIYFVSLLSTLMLTVNSCLIAKFLKRSKLTLIYEKRKQN